MKTNALVSAAAVALLAATAAVAAPPPGKGKPAAPATPPPCKLVVAVTVTGKLAADGTAAPSSLSVMVSGGNAYGKRYKSTTTAVPVAVTTTTKVIRNTAAAKPESLKSGDRVNVLAKVCRSALAHGATPDLTARRVTAHAPTS